MIFSTTVLALVSTMTAVANAHAFMSSPKPRQSGTQLSIAKNRIGRLPGRPPKNMNTVAAGCRDSVKGKSVQTVAANGNLKVQWGIVANHGSSPKISIAFDGDANFQQWVKLPSMPNN
ncbi:hypothetical protein BASA61_000139 [Batrachochytrium salamandrivorans]|nr:hypothetical protein BASA61_000139 [Batrachochytrium salamandrivorans]